jgi:anti-sigma B factor antagonist
VQTFAVEVLQTGGSVVIALQGELDVAGVPELLEALAPISRRYRPDQVTLDCRDLTFMDAAGLGAIVRSLLEQHQGEAKPILRGVNQVVMTILRVTGAAALFDVEALGEAVRHGEPFDIDDADA